MTQRRITRNLVTRSDGKLVNVPRKRGQLFVCAHGCCCGDTHFGAAPVFTELYHAEWERRKLRPHVHLSMGGCLGPCTLANVVMLLYDGHPIWFQSFNSERLVIALYDYIEAMVAAQAYLPPPPELADLQFSGFSWDGQVATTGADERARPLREGGFVFLTHADTDLLALARARTALDADFPSVRGFNVSHLKTDEDARAFVKNVVPDAEVVILRLLGGASSFRGGFERVVERAAEDDQWLVCLPGTDVLDPELTAASNVGAPIVHEAMAYLQLGGPKNVAHLLRFLSDHLLTTGFGYDAPEPQPRHGVYYASRGTDGPAVGILFYRSHLLSGNTEFVDAIVHEVERRGARAIAIFTSSLQETDAAGANDEALLPPRWEGLGEGYPASLPTALRYFVDPTGHPTVDAIISTTSFAATTPHTDETTDPFVMLGIPVIQGIAASTRREQWAESLRGLSPVDTAMNVAIPELDGRLISAPVCFKRQSPTVAANAETMSLYDPYSHGIARAVGLALRLAALRRKSNAEKRVAIILTNANAKASRIGAAVGLDTPASVIRILHAMAAAGYDVSGIPASGDALLHELIERGSYDREALSAAQLETMPTHVEAERAASWHAALPNSRQVEMRDRWGPPPGDRYVDRRGRLALPGLDLGNVFVAIQPPRGYGMDPAAIYHVPDLPPPYPYLGLYSWLADAQEDGGWGADAVIQVGKHGTLEWLPGKGVGVSESCYPDLFLRDLPLIYPFIINNPGEGAQAKRRAHATIVDHLTPPMTTAEGYGEVEELSRLVDEYYQLEQLDPTKLPLLQQQIWALIKQAQLDSDLDQLINRDSTTHTHAWDPQAHEDGVPYSISDMGARDFAHLIDNVNGYLCELSNAQIRDGLHTLGEAPRDAELVETLLSLVRLPNLNVPSLRAGVAACFDLDLPTILDDLSSRVDPSAVGALGAIVDRQLHTNADVLDAIDRVGRRLLEELASRDFDVAETSALVARMFPLSLTLPRQGRGDMRGEMLGQTLRFVREWLVPNLRRTDAEIDNVLRALDGAHVPSGPSGAPTRGMAQVLPTGRNFYTVDPRGLPSHAAWTVGQQLADSLLERHLTDEGRYPETVGISIWGTSLMRTHGDDVAEVMALIGVRPTWQAESRRLSGFDVIPLAELGRPRVDVVCRISGFFRDAFPDLIALLDRAFQAVAELDEPLDQNAIRRHVIEQRSRLAEEGASTDEAERRATYRVFGSPPGAYGAGILPLIDERNWRTDTDLAEVYVNWGGYAYTSDAFGVDARADFRTSLASVEAAVKNQDNREHDIFDSDDYFQYHGGMVAAIRATAGRNPRRYFGDSADPQRARVRDLKEEALRVFRTRVVNPKWIASMQRHGYKGALELAATVDYIFGYDATSNIVDDWMYERLARAYALDPELQRFFLQSNPWALRDVAARLMEAMDRGLWREPTPEMREAIQAAYLTADSGVEMHAGPPVTARVATAAEL